MRSVDTEKILIGGKQVSIENLSFKELKESQRKAVLKKKMESEEDAWINKGPIDKYWKDDK